MSKMRTKVFSLIAIVILIVTISAFGCKTETPEETTTETTESETTEEVETETQAESVTINVPGFLGSQTTDSIIALASEVLKEEGITIETIQDNNMGIRDKQMMSASQGDAAFDVYLAWEALMPLMKDYIEPLDQYIIDAGIDLDAFKNSFYPGVLDQISYDGQIYWIPNLACGQFGFARTDLFTDPIEQENFKVVYGYDLPVPDDSGLIVFEDADQFIDVAKFFTRDTDDDGTIDFWGYTPAGKWDHGNCVFEELLLRAGLEYFDAEGHSLWGPMHPENQQKVADVVGWMQDLIYEDMVTSPGVVGMEGTEINQFFKEGKTAMTFDWDILFWNEDIQPDVIAAWGDTKPSSWTLEFMNATPEDKGLMAIWGYSLSKDSKNKDAAFKFLMQSVDFEMWKTIHETTGLAIPNGTIEDSEWAIDNSYSPGAYATNVNSSGSIWPISKTPWAETEPVRDISREYMEKVLTGEITAEEYVQMTGNAIEELMSEAGHF